MSQQLHLEKNGLFRNAKFDFKIYPHRFPENTLCYINNAFVSVDNEKIFWECVLLGQVIPMREPAEDKKLIEQSDHLVNNMNVSLYESGKFSGIGKTTGYIMLRGKKNKKYWQYGRFNTKKVIPNTFRCLAFESVKLDTSSNFSINFVFFPSITDRNETINAN